MQHPPLVECPTQGLWFVFFLKIVFYFVLGQGFPDDSEAKNPPANAQDTGDGGSIPGWEDPLEKEMATHSSILAWEISQTEELQPMG